MAGTYHVRCGVSGVSGVRGVIGVGGLRKSGTGTFLTVRRILTTQTLDAVVMRLFTVVGLSDGLSRGKSISKYVVSSESISSAH